MNTPDLELERALHDEGYRYIAGVDEVGRGALAGPVSVGVVVIDIVRQEELLGVRDSKLLSEVQRLDLVPKIERWAVEMSVGHANSREIDEMGLTQALRLAGTRAWRQLMPLADIVILDGKHNWLSPVQTSIFDVSKDTIQVPVRPQVKADLRCQSVAAASIIAKVQRDQVLQRMHGAYPEYGWENNKGYGTAAHQSALARKGPSLWHRLSWRNIGGKNER